jgi:hypothetical protein
MDIVKKRNDFLFISFNTLQIFIDRQVQNVVHTTEVQMSASASPSCPPQVAASGSPNLSIKYICWFFFSECELMNERHVFTFVLFCFEKNGTLHWQCFGKWWPSWCFLCTEPNWYTKVSFFSIIFLCELRNGRICAVGKKELAKKMNAAAEKMAKASK